MVERIIIIMITILGLLDIIVECTLSQLSNLLLCQFTKLPDQLIICRFKLKTNFSSGFHTVIYCTVYIFLHRLFVAIVIFSDFICIYKTNLEVFSLSRNEFHQV